MRKRNQVKEATIYNNIESSITLLISFLIALAVIATFAVYVEHIPSGRRDLDLKDASDALASLLG